MIGRTLSHFEIVGKLGAGGMGEVYRAWDAELHRNVALKMLLPEAADVPDRRARFYREAHAVAALNHPNVVTLYSIEEADGVPFIVMELVEGTTLRGRIHKGGLPLQELFGLAIPVADALAAAHEKGITHRDMKPENVMIDGSGRVKVLDFGLAKMGDILAGTDEDTTASAPLTLAGRLLGTVLYMSPEQITCRPVDTRSDIFSFGLVLYEMAAGRRPFGGKSAAESVAETLYGQPRSLSEERDDLPRNLSHIVHRCLEKEPEERYQSIADVRNELRHLKEEVKTDQDVTLTVPMVLAPRRWRHTLLRLVAQAKHYYRRFRDHREDCDMDREQVEEAKRRVGEP